MKKRETSWGNVAKWYDDYLSDDKNTLQNKVILPNLIRLMDVKKGQTVLDVACGTGYFSREFFKLGANVFGVDVSPELIKIAKEKSPKEARFFVSPSTDMSFIPEKRIDKAVIVLSLQNIENVKETFTECKRVLKNDGELFIVLNHPAFRIPKASSWHWDEKNKIQFRRVDKYLSESKEEIIMNPGSGGNLKTFSFHRPLQYYFKILANEGFAVSKLEEWISHKESQPGPRKKAEDFARKEIPMFMAMKAVKSSV